MAARINRLTKSVISGSDNRVRFFLLQKEKINEENKANKPSHCIANWQIINL
jgi:hypothetical protein